MTGECLECSWGLCLAGVEQLEELAWSDHRRGGIGQVGEVPVAGDQVVGVSGAGQRDEVIVVGIGRQVGPPGWVVDDQRGVR